MPPKPYRPATPSPGNLPVRMAASANRIQAMAGVQRVGEVHLSAARQGSVTLTNLQVPPVARGQGIGPRLVQSALQQAKRLGAREVQLEARPSAGSIAPGQLVSMYQRLGFRVAGRSPRGAPLMKRPL
jgi:ribosomal protein S18 acetylase RimI-like enzyme